MMALSRLSSCSWPKKWPSRPQRLVLWPELPLSNVSSFADCSVIRTSPGPGRQAWQNASGRAHEEGAHAADRTPLFPGSASGIFGTGNNLPSSLLVACPAGRGQQLAICTLSLFGKTKSKPSRPHGKEWGRAACCSVIFLFGTGSGNRPKRLGQEKAQERTLWKRRSPSLCRWISRQSTAAGVTPEMRPAWPRLAGRMRQSFSTTSLERPATER